MSGTSVVDPIWAQLEAIANRFRTWSGIVQAFVGVTLLDIVGRALGVISPGLQLSGGSLVSWLNAFLPHDALILLPALIVIRRRDAETATPWIVRGAVVIALVELLLSPTLAIATNVLDLGQAIDVTRWLAFIFAGARAIGWLAIGVGLMRLNPPDPNGATAGLANLGFWLVAGAVLFDILTLIATPSNLNSGTIGGSFNLQAILFAALQLGFGYAVRATLRGLEDSSRSLPATRIAAVGALLSASMAFFSAVLTTFAVAAFPFAIALQAAVGQQLAILEEVVGLTLVVVAFGLGFADPLRPMAKDWEAAAAQA